MTPRFGERLKRWLDHIGMNYTEFDTAAGLTSEYTSKIVRGKLRGGMDKPTFEIRKKIFAELATRIKEPMTDTLFELGPRVDGQTQDLSAPAPKLEEILRGDTPIIFEGVDMSREERDWTLAQIVLIRKMHKRYTPSS